MTAAGWRLTDRRLQAPRADRSVFIDPPAGRLGELAAHNDAARAAWRCDLGGLDVAKLASLAREELCRAAREWTTRYRDVAAPCDPARMFLAGHQPGLFHPGVWAKNFALAQWARREGATAINLIVDNDTLAEAAIRVLAGDASAPEWRSVPFDDSAAVVPWEERPVVAAETLRTFPERVATTIRPFVTEPVVSEYWPGVLRAAARTGTFATALAEARHELEGAWGVATWECPLSRLCDGDAFAWFAACLLTRATDFREVYNATIDEYRAVHKLRSKNHPAPHLAMDGEWIEAPLWVWTADSPRRRRVFVRPQGPDLHLSDRAGWVLTAPGLKGGAVGSTADALVGLRRRGVKLRTRALTTTLFARLLLADVFVHGVGGAKYDQVTDGLLARFFGVTPPGYATLSGTLLLPVAGANRDCPRVSEIQSRLRDLAHHPETIHDMAAWDDIGQAAARTKRRWIAIPATPANARERCRAIRVANAQLRGRLDAEHHAAVELLTAARARDHAERILAWREYAFCLHPAATLRKFLLEILPAAL